MLLFICAALATAAISLYFAQTKIIFPAPPTDNYAWDPAEFGATEHWITNSDGIKVHAWLFKYTNPKATLIYSHGNAESICFTGDMMEVFRDYWQVNVVAFDYRGYGKTPGSPSEAALESDAIAVATWVQDNKELNSVPIIAMGRSMGGFTANVMASKFGLDGLILDRTFSSIEDVAASRFPLLPVRWMIRHRMRSDNWIKSYQGPLLQIHGHTDEVIPFKLGRKLFDTCPSQTKQFMEFQDLTHNVPLPSIFFKECAEFISKISNERKDFQ